MRAVGEVGRVAGKAFVCFLAVSTLALVGVAMIRSTGAAGVPGVGFITLAATLSIVPSIPLAGMALILGVDRFMSECRALDTERLAAAMVSKPMPLLPENIERHEHSGPRSEALAEAMAEAS